jgi:hypothetical protein
LLAVVLLALVAVLVAVLYFILVAILITLEVGDAALPIETIFFVTAALCIGFVFHRVICRNDRSRAAPPRVPPESPPAFLLKGELPDSSPDVSPDRD